jgi:hypothetical protein
MQRQINYTKAKVEIMGNYWMFIIRQLRLKQGPKNNKVKDSTALVLLQKLVAVPVAVRNCVLNEYIHKCKNLHSIAFLQWRLKFPPRFSELYNPKDVRKMINLRNEIFFNIKKYAKRKQYE